jgi:hypothetical protein
MNMKTSFWSLVLFACLSSGVHAAGGPMNEDLTPLAVPAQKALDASKAGNAEAFTAETQQALEAAKTKNNSAAQQRIIGKLKRAAAMGKEGKLNEGAALVEEAMSDMKKSGPPKFGGGA